MTPNPDRADRHRETRRHPLTYSLMTVAPRALSARQAPPAQSTGYSAISPAIFGTAYDDPVGRSAADRSRLKRFTTSQSGMPDRSHGIPCWAKSSISHVGRIFLAGVFLSGSRASRSRIRRRMSNRMGRFQDKTTLVFYVLACDKLDVSTSSGPPRLGVMTRT